MSNNTQKSWWGRLTQSVSGLQSAFMTKLRSIFGNTQQPSEQLNLLKRHFIEADFGPQLTKELLQRAEQSKLKTAEQILPDIKTYLRSLLPPPSKPWPEELRAIILAGVNGAGKTTTIAKIGRLYQPKNPLLVPADTYRAAAIEQLEALSARAELPFFQHQLTDPSAVAYQGLDYALKHDHLALIDTSGRLPNNAALMNELAKTKRVVLKKLTSATQLRTLLVLDASQGQNLIEQVRLFHEALQLDALIITKLDGSSKAGTIFQISQKYQLPIDYLGVGEKLTDLIPFDPDSFIESLWGQE